MENPTAREAQQFCRRLCRYAHSSIALPRPVGRSPVGLLRSGAPSSKGRTSLRSCVTLRDYIAFDPEKRRTQQLTTLMRGWQQDGSCAPLSGTGSALLRFDPNATAIIVPVEVNGVPARMIVDTGASRTALSKQLARRGGIWRA